MEVTIKMTREQALSAMVAVMSQKSCICELLEDRNRVEDVYTLSRERERLDAAYEAIKAVI